VYCIDERPKGLHTYIEEGTPNPRLEYNYHYTLNTPSQMQRECNVVAFGELTLSTRLNKKKLIHPKSEIEDVIKACNS